MAEAEELKSPLGGTGGRRYEFVIIRKREIFFCLRKFDLQSNWNICC